MKKVCDTCLNYGETYIDTVVTTKRDRRKVL